MNCPYCNEKLEIIRSADQNVRRRFCKHKDDHYFSLISDDGEIIEEWLNINDISIEENCNYWQVSLNFYENSTEICYVDNKNNGPEHIVKKYNYIKFDFRKNPIEYIERKVRTWSNFK